MNVWRVIKRILFVLWIAFALLLASFALLLNSCVSREEVQRAPSPSGRVEAWLQEENGGATTSFGYTVFLHRVGRPGKLADKAVASGYRVVRSDAAYGMNLVWTGPRTLEVRYYDADQISPSKRVRFAGEWIEVNVRGEVVDDEAPAGGMLHNLQRRSGG